MAIGVIGANLCPLWAKVCRRATLTHSHLRTIQNHTDESGFWEETGETPTQKEPNAGFEPSPSLVEMLTTSATSVLEVSAGF